MRYFDELRRAMNMLATHEKTIFLGQAVVDKGTGMSDTLVDVPLEKKLELPVCETLQMGMTNGMALTGLIPISVFPRWNFLILAADQLVNHLDKIPMISDYRPKVIVRVGVGAKVPLDPQWQHKDDFTDEFDMMCQSLDFIKLHEPSDIFPAYEKALNRRDGISTVLVEYGDYYGTK